MCDAYILYANMATSESSERALAGKKKAQDHHVLYQTDLTANDRRQKHDGLHNTDFKNRGRGGSKTRLEVTFPISDEERMRVTFSPAIENAA